MLEELLAYEERAEQVKRACELYTQPSLVKRITSSLKRYSPLLLNGYVITALLSVGAGVGVYLSNLKTGQEVAVRQEVDSPPAQAEEYIAPERKTGEAAVCDAENDGSKKRVAVPAKAELPRQEPERPAALPVPVAQPKQPDPSLDEKPVLLPAPAALPKQPNSDLTLRLAAMKPYFDRTNNSHSDCTGSCESSMNFRDYNWRDREDKCSNFCSDLEKNSTTAILQILETARHLPKETRKELYLTALESFGKVDLVVPLFKQAKDIIDADLIRAALDKWYFYGEWCGALTTILDMDNRIPVEEQKKFELDAISRIEIERVVCFESIYNGARRRHAFDLPFYRAALSRFVGGDERILSILKDAHGVADVALYQLGIERAHSVETKNQILAMWELKKIGKTPKIVKVKEPTSVDDKIYVGSYGTKSGRLLRFMSGGIHRVLKMPSNNPAYPVSECQRLVRKYHLIFGDVPVKRYELLFGIRAEEDVSACLNDAIRPVLVAGGQVACVLREWLSAHANTGAKDIESFLKDFANNYDVSKYPACQPGQIGSSPGAVKYGPSKKARCKTYDQKGNCTVY